MTTESLEEWRAIEGFENYQVSNLGQVKNIRRGCTLKPHDRGGGYMQVKLYAGGAQKNLYIHRLVAMAFIANPLQRPNIDHCDGNPRNNAVSNLRWVNQSENNMNAKKRVNAMSLYKGAVYDSRREKWASQIRINGHLVHLGYFDSDVEAGRMYDERAKDEYGDFAKLNFPAN